MIVEAAALGLGALGYGVGRLTKVKPRHRHYWEETDRKEYEVGGFSETVIHRAIESIEDNVGVYDDVDDIGAAIRRLLNEARARTDVVVTSRCPCGATKVERV